MQLGKETRRENTNGKIDLDYEQGWEGAWRSRQPVRVGFIASCFDPFIHPGVLWAMQQAVDLCGLTEIIVALHIDPTVERPEKRRPMLTVEERMSCLLCLEWVKRVIPYERERDLVNILKAVDPDVRILGDDYRGERFTGDTLKINIFYAKRREDWSGTAFHRRLRETL